MIDSTLILKFVKFCIVGFSGMVVDFGTTWLCKEKLGWNKYLSNSLGFVLAATNNYIWNRLWTFHSELIQLHAIQQYTNIEIIRLGSSS